MNSIHWLSPGRPDQRTGGYLYNARIAAELRALGVLVEVVSLEADWPLGGVSQSDKLAPIPDGATVVADGLLWPGLLADERAALLERTTVWVVVHSLMDKEGGADLAAVEASALAEAHGCFATSQRTASIVAQRLGRDSVPVIVPGTHPAQRRPRPGANRLLAVGHLIPRKGYLGLLDALASIREPAWTLDIVGSLERDPAHASAVQDAVRRRGLGDRIRFLGELGQDALERAYADSDLLVHAAHFEAFGMVLTEALRRGVPVISTPAGALDGLSSAAVRVVDSDDLGPAIDDWVGHPGALMAAQQAAELLEFPSWRGQAERLIATLGLEPHGYSTDWLQMREPYDHAARSLDLVQGLVAAVGPERATILELGAGLGSGARFVAANGPTTWEWILVDRDRRLLDSAASRLECATLQMDVHDLEALPTTVSAVTLQAVLDLASEAWLHAFAEWLSAHRLPLLAALTVDGRVGWSPAHPNDADVATAFRHHQTWDRGFGPSLGVASAHHLAGLLRDRGYRVRLHEADWAIPATDTAMVSAMIDGMAHAAQEAAASAGFSPSMVASWAAERTDQLGAVSLTVGHVDLLAVPGS